MSFQLLLINRNTRNQNYPNHLLSKCCVVENESYLLVMLIFHPNIMKVYYLLEKLLHLMHSNDEHKSTNHIAYFLSREQFFSHNVSF